MSQIFIMYIFISRCLWKFQFICYFIKQNISNFYHICTVNPVLRCHLKKKKKCPFKTVDFLKEVQFIWNVVWQDKKGWPFNTGDYFIEVITCADLTI